jgi:hypothetical protein
MEIKPTNNLGSVGRISTNGLKKAAAQPPTDAASFDNAAALKTSLDSLPAARSEEVARGRELVANPQYPPAEAVRRISNLIAGQISNPAAA